MKSDEILTQGNLRFFVQPGGARPNNPLLYSGQDSTYINIGDTTNPARGGVSPTNVQDPTRPKKYKQVARQVDAPDFPSADVAFLRKKGLPRHLTELRTCRHTFYEVAGDCNDLSDFNNGWSSYVKIYSDGLATEPSEGGSAWDSDERIEDSVPFTFSDVYFLGGLQFSEKASSEVFSEVIDITYGSRDRCGNCGPDDDGTKLIYAVANNTGGSPGEPPSIFYTKDSGLNWTQVLINGSVSTDVPTAIAVVGQYLMIVFDDGATGGYFYSEINNITGVPSATWTKVTTGFVSGGVPNDVWVNNSREVFFAGNNGYIYKSNTSITNGVTVVDAGDATTENLERIHGVEEVLVASGTNDTLVYSTDRGSSWTAITSTITGTIQALLVVDDYLWWVGTSTGGFGYTNDQGASWNSVTLSGTVSAVNDIVAPTEEVIYVSTINGDPTATIHTSCNGGVSFTTQTPRVINFPTFDRANRLAFPEVEEASTSCNNLAVAGLAGNGTDGIVLVAKTNVI